ncbi:response regulator [Ponticaulis sp.]|uniref:response regulator n=1 Tax=Ponticaulis sp. TaxID=2020902 RepID=UPI000B738E9E|nr:response regulator [Ponticaulis sp.]MAJ09876.1 DNA-binding response regulator [Ponticaulis sp.]RPG18490.1 MAG: response regulator [Hyphomonadaceae bacterium TMED125]HBH89951.1 DNA-binding response regulator [Hyphomonadaceae bacterium]|tara:strand:+ start:8936 stop:9619 length:684 start_codon:yes stop_codon:yes gene_type:complete
MNRAPSHILVVDDDDRIRDLTRRFLSNLGYHVTAANGGVTAKKLLEQLLFDLIVLDVMMPQVDGFELLEHLRQTDKTTPVIMLTARGETTDRIEGLKLGADDYLTKPFEPEELALRIAAVLRRVVVEEPVEEIEMSGLIFNLAREELKDGDKLVRLTDGETQLLKILAENAGEPVSRETLANGTSAGADRSVDVQITRLRRKIEPDPKEPIHIQTVRSIGYRLMPDA